MRRACPTNHSSGLSKSCAFCHLLNSNVSAQYMTAESNNIALDDHEREELRLLYQVSVSDIAFFKQQQWSATNYILAIYAAMLFIAYQLLEKPLTTWQQWLLVVLTWSATVGGVAVVLRLQNSILGRRTRLERVKKHFGKAFEHAWSIPKPPDDNHWLLVAIMLVGAAVVTWLVMVRVCEI